MNCSDRLKAGDVDGRQRPAPGEERETNCSDSLQAGEIDSRQHTAPGEEPATNRGDSFQTGKVYRRQRRAVGEEAVPYRGNSIQAGKVDCCQLLAPREECDPNCSDAGQRRQVQCAPVGYAIESDARHCRTFEEVIRNLCRNFCLQEQASNSQVLWCPLLRPFLQNPYKSCIPATPPQTPPSAASSPLCHPHPPQSRTPFQSIGRPIPFLVLSLHGGSLCCGVRNNKERLEIFHDMARSINHPPQKVTWGPYFYFIWVLLGLSPQFFF